MKPKSHTLFHFTKSQESLKQILENGLWPRLCLEDLHWYNSEMKFLSYPIVCLCDIPLSRIDEHVNFYGEYGIGLTKEWASRNGLNPVLYVSESSGVASALAAISWAHNKYPADQIKQASHDFFGVLAHTKPVEGKMAIGEEFLNKEFYQENEWRYLAKPKEMDPWMRKDDYDLLEKREQYNEITKKQCMLKIQPQDVKYIFVKSDSNIPDMVNFIQTKLDNYSGVDQKILMSRIISLESIRHDL